MLSLTLIVCSFYLGGAFASFFLNCSGVINRYIDTGYGAALTGRILSDIRVASLKHSLLWPRLVWLSVKNLDPRD